MVAATSRLKWGERLKNRLLKIVLGGCLVALTLVGGLSLSNNAPNAILNTFWHLTAGNTHPQVELIKAEFEPQNINGEMAKKDLADLMVSLPTSMGEPRLLEINDQNGHKLYVLTTLDPQMQTKAMSWVNNSRAHMAALVVMDPDNGEVLALAGHRADGTGGNAALSGDFPAASLFKIVTAAAAVETAEMSANSMVAYDGGKHTLYRGNVIKELGQGRQAATLKESFAESINTVFGKLGAFTLGPEELSKFAELFGFNTDIDFELPVETSIFSVTDDFELFGLAELASGFNRSTKVSPLHGAMMAAVVASGGQKVEPTLVKEVFDRNNHIYYQSELMPPDRAISPETADELMTLMRAAVENGTGRRTFHNAANDPVLSELIIGGKSGTINNEDGLRVDWFVAWAMPHQLAENHKKIALSAVVVHGGTTNTTSQRLVRDAIKLYYSEIH
ncbi:MAG: penicillin-binding transpeptidase domain-containing protein [Candidatus Adiutrix sp.]